MKKKDKKSKILSENEVENQDAVNAETEAEAKAESEAAENAATEQTAEAASADATEEKTDKSGKKAAGRGKLSRKKKIILSVIIILYVLVMAAVSIVVFYKPQISEKRKVFVVTETDEHGNVVEKEIVMNREDGSYNILLLGHDRAAMLTDVFMIVNINSVTNDITVMQIPRDTWIANHDGYYVSTNKINALFSTYYYSSYGAGHSPEESHAMALTGVEKTLENNFGIAIDYSIIMDLDGFVNIVDILGGVEVYVTQPMFYEDPGQGLSINIPEGWQTLDGKMAEGFVRFRYGYATADLGRQNAQKQFLIALFNKVKSSVSIDNIDTLTNLAEEVFNNVDTTMSIPDMLYFAKCVLKCDMSGINMMTMPGNLASGYYVVNREAVRGLLNKSFNVFEEELSDEIFDSKQIFNNAGDPAMNGVYYLPADEVYDDSVYNGEDITDDPININ